MYMYSAPEHFRLDTWSQQPALMNEPHSAYAAQWNLENSTVLICTNKHYADHT